MSVTVTDVPVPGLNIFYALILTTSLFCFEGEELRLVKVQLRSQRISGRAGSLESLTAAHRASSILPGGGDAGSLLSLLSNSFVGSETQFFLIF